MTDVLAISLHAMQHDISRLERISMNMANATTPGYKREVAASLPLSGGAFVDAMKALDASVARTTATPTAGALMVRTDSRAGTLKSTSQPLDVALGGAGFFEVSTEAGPAYTRQGNWQLDARGRLVTAQAHPVMGLGGEIILSHPHPRIDANGQVFEAAVDGRADAPPVAQIKVVQFDDMRDLERMGDGLLRTSAQPTLVAEGEVRLQQGFVENSNVSAMQEMVQLMQSMRHFEAMQKVALGYDDMIGAAVRKLGEVS